MEWYDLQPGDIIEINPIFNDQTGCVGCLGFAMDTFYIVIGVALSSTISDGPYIEYINLDIRSERDHEPIHIILENDGRASNSCIRNKTNEPLFRLVELAEEREDGVVRPQTG